MSARLLARAGVLAGTALTAALGFAGLAPAHAAAAMTMPATAPGTVTRALPSAMPDQMLVPVHDGSAARCRCECCPGSDCVCCAGGPTGGPVCRCCIGDADSAMGATRHTAGHVRAGCCPTGCACDGMCGACGGAASA